MTPERHMHRYTENVAPDGMTLQCNEPVFGRVSGDGLPHQIELFLQAQLRSYFAAHTDGLPPPGLYDRLLRRMEKPLIMQTLCATGGNQIKAAEILGINRNTLRKKMRELGIDARQLIQDAA